jgi:hypothetical protein
MVDNPDEFSFIHIINTSLDKPDDDNEIMSAVVLLVYDQEENKVQRFIVSIPGHSPAKNPNQ